MAGVTFPQYTLGERIADGCIHVIGVTASLVALTALIIMGVQAQATLWIVAVSIYGLALVAMFTCSAGYNLIVRPKVKAVFRRLDHAAIFIMIAGGYTPLFTLVPSASGGHGALLAIWLGSSVGVVKSLVWPGAPKWLTALLCVGLGWMVVGEVIERSAVIGSVATGLLVASGLTYSAGALVYARKRPDPWPRVFGYHEVFHLLVIVASGLLFAHVVLLMRGR